MVNKFKGEVGINVDGEDYTLVMDMNVMAEVEDTFGDKIEAVLETVENGKAPIKTLRALAHLMLQPRHPGATLETAGDVLSEDGSIVIRAIIAASPAAAAEMEKEAAGNAPKATGEKRRV